MPNTSSSEISRVERDPDLFVWFLTLVIASLYVLTLVNQPEVRQPVILVIFTGLVIVHLVLHWRLGLILDNPRKTTWYILGQGVLALVIGYLANNPGMSFAIFMGLVGEAIGMFGLTRKGMLAVIYYLLLLAANLVQLSGWGDSRPLLLTLIPMTIFVILFVTLYMRQAEAREQAQKLAAELETANRQLAEYAARVEELTLTTERQRMARELHDTLSQGVAGLVLQLEAVKAHLEAGRNERAAAIIDQSLARARSTLAESRAAIDDLRAVPASLSVALRTKVERFSQATGIPCELSFQLGENVLPQPTGDHLLGVLREALANVTRHAQASHVWVRLQAENQHLALEIRDDGIGFDPEIVTGVGHYGLLGMRERARLVGGALEIESAAGQGTCLRLVAPLSQES